MSQLIASTGCALADKAFGWQSDPYRVLYVGLTLPVLVLSFVLVYEAGARWSLLIAFLAAGTAGIIAYFDYTGIRDFDFWSTFIEACILVFLGMGMVFRAPFQESMVPRILSVLWIFLAIYDFHFLLNTKMPVLDYVAPIWLVDSACIAVALTKRQPALKEVSFLR